MFTSAFPQKFGQTQMVGGLVDMLSLLQQPSCSLVEVSHFRQSKRWSLVMTKSAEVRG
jgi:hypothetical protein